MADHAVRVGPPAAAESYLRIPSVIAAADTTGCQAVHPGYGFLAENPAFVEACVDNDLVFVGPPADVMATMGDKISAKQAMRARGRADGAGHRRRDVRRRGARRPPTRWATRSCSRRAPGGGGKGMRLVTVAGGRSRTRSARRRPRRRRRSATRGSTSRRRSSPARHVEIQVLCDDYGNVLTLGERECSIQRRHQKLIEESPSAALTPETREADGGRRRARVPRRRLPQRRHVRVPARPGRQLLLHRAERAAPGRAPGDRARARASTSCASSCASPRASRSRSPAARRGAGTRSRSG